MENPGGTAKKTRNLRDVKFNEPRLTDRRASHGVTSYGQCSSKAYGTTVAAQVT